MNTRYTPTVLREGTAARLRQQLTSARAFLDAIEQLIDMKRVQDTQQSAEALSTTTDRILSSCTVLRALDSLEEKP